MWFKVGFTVALYSSQNWTSAWSCTCSWQELGHSSPCSKCMTDADAKGSALAMEQDLGCLGSKVQICCCLERFEHERERQTLVDRGLS